MLLLMKPPMQVGEEPNNEQNHGYVEIYCYFVRDKRHDAVDRLVGVIHATTFSLGGVSPMTLSGFTSSASSFG